MDELQHVAIQWAFPSTAGDLVHKQLRCHPQSITFAAAHFHPAHLQSAVSTALDVYGWGRTAQHHPADFGLLQLRCPHNDELVHRRSCERWDKLTEVMNKNKHSEHWKKT